jgi:hypothetical protein
MSVQTFPTIHVNGDTGEKLCADFLEAYKAICHAEDLLAVTGPNGRNYYPQGPEALIAAIEEHQERMALLSKVGNECLELAKYCADNSITPRKRG